MRQARPIGGALTMDAYAALARRHEPTDATALAAEIQRLHGTGLTSRDIASALRLPVDRVVAALAGMGSP